MTPTEAPPWRFYTGLALRLVVIVVVILAAIHLSRQIQDAIGIEIMPHNEALMYRIILLALLAYVVMTALPFVPGAEIGMTLLTVFGPGLAPLVYAGTVLSLMLAYGAGRLVPQATTARALRRWKLPRAAALMERLAALPGQDRPGMLVELIDTPALTRLAQHRYIALMVLINMPGNVVIGGGGGIAFAAGLSGVFAPHLFLAAVLLAVLPVPLAIFLLGG
ncbi:hypothetical protein [Roseivivax sp. CAU 1753]